MKCPICSDQFEPKRSDAKTCGKPACRKKLQRQTINGELVKKNLPPLVEVKDIPILDKKEQEEIVEDILVNIATPNLSYRPTPGSPEWCVHGTASDPDKTWDRVCVRCGKKYTTSLSLMSFCSNECKSEVMVVIANGPHESYIKWQQGGKS